ncbi:MAG: PBP1A family penicillin-binding protein, partial [bacterium]|nr:PBP1A family penicillin-binding protein [bacterium]
MYNPPSLRRAHFPSRHAYQDRLVRQKRAVFIVSGLASLFIFLLVAGSIFSMVFFAIYSKNLPSPTKLIDRDVALSTKILDRNGKLLYDIYGEKNRTLVKLEDVSPFMLQATLATEDSNFYKHQGFATRGYLRAVLNMLRGEGLQGGSTITQQLVKNALLTQERTVSRKLKEFILALQIEKKYTKREILQMYLNEAPYGGQAWGVETAAQMYFEKPAKDLDLAEAAMLAGLPQSPSRYSPFLGGLENTKGRQSYVLHLMRDKGWTDENGNRVFLSSEEAEKAKAEELKLSKRRVNIEAPHFVMYVKDLLTQRYGEDVVEGGGLQVTTTLDLEKQNQVQDIITQGVKDSAKYKISNGAAVAMDPKTGQILAMVGSKDYFAEDYDGKYNVAVQALRQPGSSIKPVTYVTALKQGYTASYILYDTLTHFKIPDQPDYVPKNYDGNFRGPVRLRTALSNSLNVPAVKMMDLVGIEAFLQTAHEMGITTMNDRSRIGLSLTLGGGEVRLLDMATAFSTLASMGVRHDPVAILKVTDPRGKVLEEARNFAGERVMPPEYPYIMADIMFDDNERAPIFGSHSWLYLPGHRAAVKTGTTDEKKDNWTVGFTPSLTIAVWIGNNDNSSMLTAGSEGAAPIWNKAMLAFLKDKPDEWYEKPENVEKQSIDKAFGSVVCGGSEATEELFVKGTEPGPCLLRRNVRVCRPDGQLASKMCEDAGQAEDREFIFLKEAKEEWQPYLEAWIEATHKDDPLYHPPADVSLMYFNPDGSAQRDGRPLVSFLNLAANQVLSPVFRVDVGASSPVQIKRVDFYLGDRDLQGTDVSAPYSFE